MDIAPRPRYIKVGVQRVGIQFVQGVGDVAFEHITLVELVLCHQVQRGISRCHEAGVGGWGLFTTKVDTRTHTQCRSDLVGGPHRATVNRGKSRTLALARSIARCVG